MAGIMVSASTGVMNSLLRKLFTLMGDEFAKLKNLRKEVRSISEELRSMNNFIERLSDVDDLDKQTKGWRDEVREMSFDIEDIIDDFVQQIGQKDQNSGIVENTIERLKALMARHRVASRIREIKKLVHETSERRKRYKLDMPPSSDVPIDPRIVTLYENAANLVGLEGPTNEVLNWLKDEGKQLKVLSIVGFGGLGKTTLASEVYRRLKGEFDCGAFVTVSQTPSIPKLVLSLLYELGGGIPLHDCELNLLLNKLREHLQNKRYFIIVDDIWDENVWGVIKCAFPENDLGSRVLATTRIQNVARACCYHSRDYILIMKPLSNEDSRRLFFGRIFNSEEACPCRLKEVSVDILKKCGGLPLAIISISGLLASEGSNQEEWEHVRNSLGSGTNFTLERMRQILNLSYKNLPPHLKTCLLYLGMYPEDYTIERSDLERQWLAEGFICKQNEQDLEKVARKYFNELVNRSLIQPVKFDNKGPVTECKVHDMMLNLILLKSAEENFFTIVDGPQAVEGLDYKTRRLSIRLDGASNGQAILPSNISMSQVRSVMFFGSSQNTPPLSVFKFLRVLFINLDNATVDLTGLCKLHQLRYLWISYNCSYQLPTQIRGLRYLQTLGLRTYSSFPSDIVHLPRLMHMTVQTWLPDGIGSIKSLRHLYGFDLVVNTLDNIKGLGELTNLRYLLVGCGLRPNDWERRMDALCSSLGKLCSLEYLFVNLMGCIDVLMPMSHPLTPYRLKRFVLSSRCWFSRVPSWMGQLHNITELECQVSELLNDGVSILAEFPALTDLDLKIRRRSIREMITIHGRGAFPALKRFELQLSRASHLTFQDGAMPRLQKLKLNFNTCILEQNGVTPAGIEHLLALEEFSANIGCYGTTESEKTGAEFALRSAINMHPCHPRVEINLLGYNLSFFHN